MSFETPTGLSADVIALTRVLLNIEAPLDQQQDARNALITPVHVIPLHHPAPTAHATHAPHAQAAFHATLPTTTTPLHATDVVPAAGTTDTPTTSPASAQFQTAPEPGLLPTAHHGDAPAHDLTDVLPAGHVPPAYEPNPYGATAPDDRVDNRYAGPSTSLDSYADPHTNPHGLAPSIAPDAGGFTDPSAYPGQEQNAPHAPHQPDPRQDAYQGDHQDSAVQVPAPLEPPTPPTYGADRAANRALLDQLSFLDD